MSTVAAPERPAYREPAYLRYVLGQAVSNLGDAVWSVALAWAAIRVASPGVAGLVLAASSVPRVVLVLFGGPLADRYDARRLMIGSDALRALVVLAAAGVALIGPSIGLLVAVALVFGTVDAVFLPASGSVRPRLLRPGQYSGGAALYELTNRAALALGGPLGGVLIAFGGLALGCAVDAITFLVSMVTLWKLRPRAVAGTARAREPYPAALRRGLAYLARHPVLRIALLTGLLTNAGLVGPVNIGLAILADRRHWGPSGIGAMLAGFGVGAAAAALILLRLRVRRGLGTAIAAACAAQGGTVLLLGLAPSLPAAVLAAALIGGTSGVLGVLLTSVVQATTDDAYRGRVASVSMLTGLGVTPVAMSAFGALVGAFGTVPVFAGSAALGAGAGVLCLAAPAFRRVTVS